MDGDDVPGTGMGVICTRPTPLASDGLADDDVHGWLGVEARKMIKLPGVQ